MNTIFNVAIIELKNKWTPYKLERMQVVSRETNKPAKLTGLKTS